MKRLPKGSYVTVTCELTNLPMYSAIIMDITPRISRRRGIQVGYDYQVEKLERDAVLHTIPDYNVARGLRVA